MTIQNLWCVEVNTEARQFHMTLLGPCLENNQSLLGTFTENNAVHSGQQWMMVFVGDHAECVNFVENNTGRLKQ